MQNTPSDSYFDKVWRGMISQPIPSSFDIEGMVAPGNREAFIEAVKMFIDFDYGKPEYYLEFSNDYKFVNKKSY